jgi:hypothetical protein
MTKEQVFQMLDTTIHYIHERFCEANSDYLIDQLQGDPKFADWSMESGISKAVLLIKGEPFVIKLPFSCMYEEEYYDDMVYEWQDSLDCFLQEKLGNDLDTAPQETILNLKHQFYKENPEPQPDDERWYLELEGANYVDLPEVKDSLGWDYCQLECAIYNEAVKRGLGAYFAEEGFLGELSCGHPVYYQQRCVPFSEITPDYSEKTEKRRTSAKATCKQIEMYCFNSLWIADFLEQYGADELARLNAFLKEMNIGDLRDCNIGYLDGAPILFDYSGFRQWD